MCSWTAQRGGKITKSAMAVPGLELGQVRTVKIDGSCREEKGVRGLCTVRWFDKDVLEVMFKPVHGGRGCMWLSNALV